MASRTKPTIAEELAAEPTVLDNSLTLLQRLTKAREIIGGIVEKTGHNKDQSYDYVSAADVARKVGDALAQVGVTQIVNHELNQPPLQYSSNRGTAMFMAVVTTTLTLVKSEDKVIGGSLQGVPNSPERVVIITVGYGADTGDKGPFKAMTGALKYAQLHALGLATGDDPEKDAAEVAPAAANTADAPTARPRVQQRRRDEPPAKPEANAEEPAAGDAPVSQPESAATVGDNPNEKITPAQNRLLFAEANKVFGTDTSGFRYLIFLTTGKHATSQLTNQDVTDVLEAMADEAIVTRARTPEKVDIETLKLTEAAGEGSTVAPVVGPAWERAGRPTV